MPWLRLWQGHRHPNGQLSGWGKDGPTFGTILFFHIIYGCDIKFGDDRYCLNLVEEFVYDDGMYYDDWSFCDQLDEGMQSGLVTFDPRKAVRVDRRPGNLQPCISQNEGGVSDTGAHKVECPFLRFSGISQVTGCCSAVPASDEYRDARRIPGGFAFLREPPA